MTFFVNPKFKEYIIIFGISLITSLYFFEGYYTFVGKGSYSSEQLYESQKGKKWDKRSRYRIYKDLKNLNDEITVSVNPQNYINNNKSIFSLSGISNSKTIHCNENGYFSIYQSDRYGFNNIDKNWDEKEIEYILIGDSFVHGACVNRPNDFTSVLESLSNTSVLNLGYDGNGPLKKLATLREYSNSNIKNILWFYSEINDLSDLKTEIREKKLMNYFNDLTFTQSLKLKQNEIDDLAKKQVEIEMEKHILKNLRNFLTLFNTRTLILQKPPPPPMQSEPLPEFKKILELAKNLAIKNNSKLYFVYLPEYIHYKKKYDETNYNLVKDIVNKLNIPLIDIHKEVFEKEENPFRFFPFEFCPHYNIEGYKKVSEIIYNLTKE